MSEKELPQAKPRPNQAKQGYLVHECPYCHQPFQVITERVVEVETDEFGKMKRDEAGRLIPKTTTSFKYQTFTEVVPVDQNTQKIREGLWERNAKERQEIMQLTQELSEPKPRKKKDQLLAEIAA